MFITLTNYHKNADGQDKININLNYIVGVWTVARDSKTKYTCVATINSSNPFHITETQEEVMAMINAALAREYNTVRPAAGNRLSNILGQKSA